MAIKGIVFIEGTDIETDKKSVHAIMFKKEKGWDYDKAISWLKSNKFKTEFFEDNNAALQFGQKNINNFTDVKSVSK